MAADEAGPAGHDDLLGAVMHVRSIGESGRGSSYPSIEIELRTELPGPRALSRADFGDGYRIFKVRSELRDTAPRSSHPAHCARARPLVAQELASWHRPTSH